MPKNILKKISNEYKKYSIDPIDSGASKKNLYRLSNKNNSFILIDFVLDKKEYKNHLKIYDLLKDKNLSIPKIIENNEKDLLIITEDFGELRFDKILHKFSIRKLLSYAVENLIILNKTLLFDNNFALNKYHFKSLKKEILELPKYYFPYIKLNNKNLNKEFIYIWSEAYKNFNFKFDNFVHKDFNINNLILIPNRKNHLKCGIIDFQSAFWGESSWDLFSLLEDSRILFTDEFNEYFINLFYSNTNQNISLANFKMKFYFLNLSRQTRLLGRWIKLAKEFNQRKYLNFIPITQQRLKKSISVIEDKNLIKFYNDYIIST